jgi:hypothetical protein
MAMPELFLASEEAVGFLLSIVPMQRELLYAYLVIWQEILNRHLEQIFGQCLSAECTLAAYRSGFSGHMKGARQR